ncbi:MAG: hypothetical protein ACK553_09100 [Planctomycetota bacterium]|jgi:hypothetical protein
MRAPNIRTSGAAPGADGQVNLYISGEAREQSWFNPQRRVVFVNGMLNSPSDHRDSATALSLLQGCPVIGVYNRTDGFWSDLGQCITDKARLVHIQAEVGHLNFAQWVSATQALFQQSQRFNPSLTLVDFVGSLIQDNAATYALYGLLAGEGGIPRSTPIYCHSQGNLITSNALTAVALALGVDALRDIEVHSFGSPCRYWPPGISRVNNAFTFDPVSWLDLRVDLSSSKIGFVCDHAFTRYMQHDAEFIVNRFRWGSFGLTASMDEVGLAEYLIRLGNNPTRVKPVFERLRDAHPSDSDDVAYEYTSRASDSLLRSLKGSSPSLINLLIELMDSGWTSSEEQEAILRLRAL